jgi:hypothetical protein
VGASLLAKALDQLDLLRLTRRFREQARSHRVQVIYVMCYVIAFLLAGILIPDLAQPHDS